MHLQDHRREPIKLPHPYSSPGPLDGRINSLLKPIQIWLLMGIPVQADDVGESWQARGGGRGTASRGQRRPCLGTAPGGMQTGTGGGGRTGESEPARGARAGRAGGVWVGGGVP